MALDGTYAGMQASIADFLNRTDLTASIPDFIIIAEADLNRKLNTRLEMVVTTLTIATEYSSVPSDFQGPITFTRSDNYPLDEISPDALSLQKYENSSSFSAGSPRYFAVVGSQFQLFPAPTASDTYSLTYYQNIPPLASNPTGNYLSKNHPDAYLYGSLAAAAPYLQNDERLQVWSSLYQNAVDSIGINDFMRYGERLTPQPTFTQII